MIIQQFSVYHMPVLIYENRVCTDLPLLRIVYTIRKYIFWNAVGNNDDKSWSLCSYCFVYMGYVMWTYSHNTEKGCSNSLSVSKDTHRGRYEKANKSNGIVYGAVNS